MNHQEWETVPVSTEWKPLRSIDPEGNPITIGGLQYRDYQEDGFRGVWYLPEKGEPVRLGSATPQFQVVSHNEVLEPLMEQGWEPRLVFHRRKGAVLNVFFAHPEQVLSDPISWDHQDGDHPVHLAIRVYSDLRVGHGFRLVGGFFRVVCENGLVSELLGLGLLRISHPQFSPEAIRDFGERLLEISAAVPEPRIPVKVLSYAREKLEISGNWERGTVEENLSRLPSLVRPYLRILTDQLSRQSRQELASQLGLLISGSPVFGILDLLNAVTNSATSSRSRPRIYHRIETLIQALWGLVEIGSLIHDIPIETIGGLR